MGAGACCQDDTQRGEGGGVEEETTQAHHSSNVPHPALVRDVLQATDSYALAMSYVGTAYRLARIPFAFPLKIASLCAFGRSSDSTLDTLRSIDPSRCG